MSGQTAASITVAIACYNQGQFLAEAVDSVLAQSRAADAVLIVDDGSRDVTPRIAALYPQVDYHRQDNAGLSAARNTALALARTSHLLFLDADDILAPTALAAAIACFARNDGLALAYGGYRDITVLRDPIAEREPVQHEDAFTALLHDNFIGMHGTVLYETALLRAAGGFDTSLSACEDWDVYLRLARHHPIASYGGIGADYRRHGASMSGNTARMITTSRMVLERQLAGGLTPEQAAAARRGIAFSRRHYALKLIGEFNGSLATASRTLALGFRHDPLFAFRLAAALPRALVRRLGLSRSSPPAPR